MVAMGPALPHPTRSQLEHAPPTFFLSRQWFVYAKRTFWISGAKALVGPCTEGADSNAKREKEGCWAP